MKTVNLTKSFKAVWKFENSCYALDFVSLNERWKRNDLNWLGNYRRDGAGKTRIKSALNFVFSLQIWLNSYNHILISFQKKTMIPLSKHDQENAISEVQGWFETVNHPSYCEGQWTQFVFDPSSIKASSCIQAFLPLSRESSKDWNIYRKWDSGCCGTWNDTFWPHLHRCPHCEDRGNCAFLRNPIHKLVLRLSDLLQALKGQDFPIPREELYEDFK